MDSVSSTDESNRAAFGAAEAEAFVSAVAEALPSVPIWSMPVLVGVSGGADSMALLLALRKLLPHGLERRLIVAHVEHDIRDSAATDRQFVVETAARLGLACLWRTVAVRDHVDDEGIEGTARRLRYECLASLAGDQGARHVLVGHTADDQAETILQRMLRGTGLAGIGGMVAAREFVPGISLLRPLLGLSRGHSRRFLEAIGQPWREDPTNDDVRYSRNFVRHELLGRCACGPFPAATRSLIRLGHQASLVATALRSAAEHLLEVHSSRQRDGSILVRTRGLASLDRHLLAEVFVALWRREGWPQRGMTARHYAALAALTGDASPPRSLTLPGSVVASRDPSGAILLRTPSR